MWTDEKKGRRRKGREEEKEEEEEEQSSLSLFFPLSFFLSLLKQTVLVIFSLLKGTKMTTRHCFFFPLARVEERV